jgi:hypothetical protein
VKKVKEKIDKIQFVANLLGDKKFNKYLNKEIKVVYSHPELESARNLRKLLQKNPLDAIVGLFVCYMHSTKGLPEEDTIELIKKHVKVSI